MIADSRAWEFTKFYLRGRRTAPVLPVPQQFLIGGATQPQRNKNGDFFVRIGFSKGPEGVKSLLLSGAAIRRYFYRVDGQEDLYKSFGASEAATSADLRIAWRMKQLEVGARAAERSRVERAFNILGHPELRKCYDLLRRNEDAPPLCPYAGKGSILLEGGVSRDGETLFADRILAYKPELAIRRVSLLLRKCEFLTDWIVYQDAPHKLEVWIDGNLVPDLRWDLTWNYWKRWLKSRIEVDATFVHITSG